MSRKSKAERQALIKAGQEKAAECATDSILMCANALHSVYAKVNFEDGIRGIDCQKAGDVLQTSAISVTRGNLSEVEEMLMAQSKVLENLFVVSVMRAQEAQYADVLDLHMTIALKAQNQCRRTLATLADLKNPRRATFIKQQNNAVNQQVNNGGQPEKPKIPEQSSYKLLEDTHGERLDTRAAGASIEAYPEMATVGEVHGATD